MSFISGISITCFAASYLVAWLLELTRLLFRSGVRGAVMLGFAVAGLFAQTLFLGYRAWQLSTLPLSSSFDWYLLAAWMLAASYLYLTYYYPRAAVGLYLWPLILGLIAAAAWFADPAPIAPEPASRVWGMIHGVFLLLGTVTVMVGFAAGVMYLIQADRLKRKHLHSGGIQLPNLEWLEHVNSRVVFASALMVGVGFVAGVVLKVIGGKTQLPWTDPVVWSSGLMWGWLVVAALFNLLYRPARHGRKVAYLTLASFIFLVISLGILLLVNTEHGGQKTKLTGPQAPGATTGVLGASMTFSGATAGSPSNAHCPKPQPTIANSDFGLWTLDLGLPTIDFGPVPGDVAKRSRA